MNKPLVLHPLLLATFPILALLVHNLEWIPLSDVARAPPPPTGRSAQPATQ